MDRNCHAPMRKRFQAMFDLSSIKEPSDDKMPETVRPGTEESRAATAKMLDFHQRMGIRVTPQMTLASEPKKRNRKVKAAAVS